MTESDQVPSYKPLAARIDSYVSTARYLEPYTELDDFNRVVGLGRLALPHVVGELQQEQEEKLPAEAFWWRMAAVTAIARSLDQPIGFPEPKGEIPSSTQLLETVLAWWKEFASNSSQQ